MTDPTCCPRCGVALPAERQLRELCPACLLELQMNADPEPSPDPRPAPELETLRAHFPDLELQEPIGRGGMGFVYRARHKRLDRLVALKVLDPALAAEPGFAERFEREARALARLDHPNVVRVHDVGCVSGTYYLTMEYVDGENLRDAIRSGALTPARTLALVPQICAGLQYAHEHGVVHRDIKPENILVDARGRVKVADFGLAKLLDRDAGDASLTRASQAMGTPQYMAPEQLRGAAGVDHRADIYSLGVVIYELLTGGLPVGNFRLPSDCAAVDARLDEVVLKALEPEPAQRFQRVSEVQSELEGNASAAPPSDSSWADASWADSVPGGALAVVGASVPLAWLWLVVTCAREDLPLTWAAVAYPAAFVGYAAARTLPFGQQRAPVGASLATAVAAAALCATDLDLPPGFIALGALAGALIVAAHLLFERWLRTGSWTALATAAAPFLGAVVVHSAPYAARAGREAYYYASGMLALIAAASLAALLPPLAMGGATRRDQLGLLRALVVGVIAAAFYFHRQLF